MTIGGRGAKSQGAGLTDLRGSALDCVLLTGSKVCWYSLTSLLLFFAPITSSSLDRMRISKETPTFGLDSIRHTRLCFRGNESWNWKFQMSACDGKY